MGIETFAGRLDSRHNSGGHRELSMSGRTIACGLVALSMLANAERTARRRSAEPPLRQIDHVMIKADDPREVLAFFTEALGLPTAWQVEERGGVVSGGVGFGNVNVEAIRFPGQPSLPSRAQLTGFGFEPSSMRACLDELRRRGVSHGPLRPLISTDTNGAKHILFTNVTLLGLSDSALPVDATMHIFVSEYDPTYVDVASRRARLSEALAATRGGPLGVASMSEIVVGSSDVDTMRLEWQRLLDPARPTRAGAWPVGAGPAIRVVPATENRVEELVVRVRSLARAKAFLYARGLLAREPAAKVMLDPSKVFGIKMRLVQ
jgi:catechol 2,3-dioxygenase-like lactoylglutathione lyase family enzyme